MAFQKYVLAAAVALAAVPAAFASSGSTWVGGEAGFETHEPELGKSRAQVRAELDDFVRNGGTVASGELDYQAPHQHIYLVQDGRSVHADNASAMGNVAAPTRFEQMDPYLKGGPN
jgi:hypothetical protein